MGSGWGAAHLNNEKEFEFIRQGQRGFSDAKSYWIGGSTDAAPYEYFGFNLYTFGDAGDSSFLFGYNYLTLLEVPLYNNF